MQEPDVTESLAKKLAPILEPLQASIQTNHYRVVPSTFSATDPYLRALPLKDDWRWSSLENHLKRFAPETVILQLPVFWQLEPFVYTAARGAKAAISIIEPQNHPLDKAAIRFASAQAFVAEAAEAAAIAAYLHAGGIELPPYWVVVHAADAYYKNWKLSPLLTNKNLQIAQEMHLAPGIPLLVQCEHIVAAHSNAFHPSDTFIWNSDYSAPAISTTDAFVFAFKDFALPFRLTNKGMCPCGKDLFTVQ